MNKYFSILNLFELLAFLIGIVQWKKFKHSPSKYFIFLLGFILLGEAIGKYLRLTNQNELKTYWYACFDIPIQFITYYWLFAKRLKSQNLFRISSSILLISIPLEYIVLVNKDYSFSSISYLIGNLLLLLITLQYYYKLTKSDEILNFHQDLFFWIALGIMVFYLPTLPYYGLLNYLKKKPTEIFIKFNYFHIILDCLMYIIFSIGLLWKRNH